MLGKEAEDGQDVLRSGDERAAEDERAERVARVIESVRSGTYKVRSDVVANRLIDSMLRRPKKG